MKILGVAIREHSDEPDYFPIGKLDSQGDEYRFHYCSRGKGIIRINNELLSVHENDIVLTYPDEKFSFWSSSGGTFQIYSIRFMLVETEYDLYNLINMELRKERPYSSKKNFGALLRDLYEKVHDGSRHKEVSARYLLLSILYEMSATEEEEVRFNSEQKEYIDKTVSFIRNNLDRNVSLSELCNHVNLTESYLIKIFHKYAGTTPIKFHSRLRIEYACRLLTESLHNIPEVTEMLDFSSESHFCRTFKKFTGISPYKYKQQYIAHMGHEETSNVQEVSRMFHFLQIIIDSAPDLIFFKDKQGVLLGCNHAFCKIMGMSKDEIIGKRDLDIFPEDEARFYMEKDKRIFESGRAFRNEEWMTYPDGEKRKFEVYKGPLFDAEDNLIGLVGVSRDITDLVDAENEPVKAHSRL